MRKLLLLSICAMILTGAPGCFYIHDGGGWHHHHWHHDRW